MLGFFVRLKPKKISYCYLKDEYHLKTKQKKTKTNKQKLRQPEEKFEKIEAEMQAKGAVSFIEPPHLFSAVPVPPASLAFPYPSLPQSDSRKGEGNGPLDSGSLH